MNVLFRKNLGYLFDVCNIIICKTAPREAWIRDYISHGNEEYDLRCIEHTLDRFNMVNDKLLLLSFKTHKTNSLLSSLFIQYANAFYDAWSKESFVSYISDVNVLKQALVHHYLGDNVEPDNVLQRITSDSEIPVHIKYLLMDFFLFPDSFTQMFKDVLFDVFQEMDRYYNENLNIILECQESFNIEKLLDIDLPVKRIASWKKRLDTAYVSFSIFSKYQIAKDKAEKSGWLILGNEYKYYFSEYTNLPVDVASFGNALGDKLRVKILELIVEKGEMTLAQLAKEMNVVNTIAIYHLDILKKENLLLHRYQGRQVFYCINVDQFLKATDGILNLCKIK